MSRSRISAIFLAGALAWLPGAAAASELSSQAAQIVADSNAAGLDAFAAHTFINPFARDPARRDVDPPASDFTIAPLIGWYTHQALQPVRDAATTRELLTALRADGVALNGEISVRAASSGYTAQTAENEAQALGIATQWTSATSSAQTFVMTTTVDLSEQIGEPRNTRSFRRGSLDGRARETAGSRITLYTFSDDFTHIEALRRTLTPASWRALASSFEQPADEAGVSFARRAFGSEPFAQAEGFGLNFACDRAPTARAFSERFETSLEGDRLTYHADAYAATHDEQAGGGRPFAIPGLYIVCDGAHGELDGPDEMTDAERSAFLARPAARLYVLVDDRTQFILSLAEQTGM